MTQKVYKLHCYVETGELIITEHQITSISSLNYVSNPSKGTRQLFPFKEQDNVWPVYHPKGFEAFTIREDQVEVLKQRILEAVKVDVEYRLSRLNEVLEKVITDLKDIHQSDNLTTNKESV